MKQVVFFFLQLKLTCRSLRNLNDSIDENDVVAVFLG